MKVRDLINKLEQFDSDTEVRIGMQQRYGSDFAMHIVSDIDEFKISSFYGKDYRAVVLTEGSQCGTVGYDDEEEDE